MSDYSLHLDVLMISLDRSGRACLEGLRLDCVELSHGIKSVELRLTTHFLIVLGHILNGKAGSMQTAQLWNWNRNWNENWNWNDFWNISGMISGILE